MSNPVQAEAVKAISAESRAASACSWWTTRRSSVKPFVEC